MNYSAISNTYACSPPEDIFQSSISSFAILDQATNEDITKNFKFSVDGGSLTSASSLIGSQLLDYTMNLGFITIPPQAIKKLNVTLQITFYHDPELVYVTHVDGPTITP